MPGAELATMAGMNWYVVRVWMGDKYREHLVRDHTYEDAKAQGFNLMRRLEYSWAIFPVEPNGTFWDGQQFVKLSTEKWVTIADHAKASKV